MAKASTYANDGTIVGGDKWIGTDAADGSTKNYTASGVETYMKTNSGVDGGDNFVGETSVQTITNKTINDSTFEYDNTSSGLTATDVESAIDELASEKQDTSEKGQAFGYAGLGASGKVLTSQLPDSVLGTLSYQGTWNASTNTPTIPAASSGNKGHYYVVSTAGSTDIDGETDWKIGDWIVSNGVSWDKIDNTDKVSSVNGFTGAVTLDYDDVGAEQAFTKNTAFNKNFGTEEGQVAEGNHVHFSKSTFTPDDPNDPIPAPPQNSSVHAVSVTAFSAPSSITVGFEGQVMTIFARGGNIELSDGSGGGGTTNLEITEVGGTIVLSQGVNGQFDNITLQFIDGVWRQTSLTQYP